MIKGITTDHKGINIKIIGTSLDPLDPLTFIEKRLSLSFHKLYAS